MFIEKSKQAISVIDAHTGERDYLKVDKDSTGFTIKVPAGKTKLKITKWYGVGQERTQEFNVVGSGSEKGVSGMTQITTGNAFAEDYCENYSGYGANSLENDCTPKIVGAVDGVAVYRTPCQKEFFEFELSANQKIELFVEDVILIEKTYSATLKQNLSVKETLGLKAFEDYFGTGVILNELHEADRVFFADGLPIEVNSADYITVKKDIDNSLEPSYGGCNIYCTYEKTLSGYICKTRKVVFYFFSDDTMNNNLDYLKQNFTQPTSVMDSYEFRVGFIAVQLYATERTIFAFYGQPNNFYVELYRDSYDEELSSRENLSIEFFNFGIIQVFKGSVKTIIARKSDGIGVDMYPKFNVGGFDTNASVPKVNSLGTVFKYLKEVQSLGLYPELRATIVDDMTYAVIASEQITLVDGWNNAEVMAELRKGRTITKVFLYLTYDSGVLYAGGLSLGREYVPSVSIWGVADVYEYYAHGDDQPLIFTVQGGTLEYNAKTMTQISISDVLKAYSLVESIRKIEKITCSGYSWSFELTRKSIIYNHHYFQDGKMDNDLSIFASLVEKIVTHENPSLTLNYLHAERVFINKNILVNNDMWHGGFPDTFIKKFLLICNSVGASVFLQPKYVILDTQVAALSRANYKSVYELLDVIKESRDEDFTLEKIRLWLQYNEDLYRYWGAPKQYDVMDISRAWTTYENGVFSTREKIGTTSTTFSEELSAEFYTYSMPFLLKIFLQAIVIPKMNLVYSNLGSMQIYVSGYVGQSITIPFSSAQKETIMRSVFNEFIATGEMAYKFRATITIVTEGSSGESTQTVTPLISIPDLSGALPTLSVAPPAIEYGTYKRLSSATASVSEDTISDAQEAIGNEVTITVTDASKTRTIVYASPIEIASISIDGERIDVGNRMIDADIPRKFSIGNATVTWKNSTITVYNFGAVMSLKIGDASFII